MSRDCYVALPCDAMFVIVVFPDHTHLLFFMYIKPHENHLSSEHNGHLFSYTNAQLINRKGDNFLYSVYTDVSFDKRVCTEIL